MSNPQIVTCDLIANRFVVRKHNLYDGLTDRLELVLTDGFAWLQTAWVTNDYLNKCFTVRFGPDASFEAASECTRQHMHEEVVERTLRFIAWPTKTTTVVFTKH